jgi:hypothetical protein
MSQGKANGDRIKGANLLGQLARALPNIYRCGRPLSNSMDNIQVATAKDR